MNNKTFLWKLFLLTFYLYGFSCYATMASVPLSNLVCLRGDPSNTFFLDQLKNSNDPFIKAFRESNSVAAANRAASVAAASCDESKALNAALTAANMVNVLSQTVTDILPAPCVSAALSREVDSRVHLCERNNDGALVKATNSVSVSAKAKNLPCIDSQVAKYVTENFNRAVKCFPSILKPITLFHILNNESAMQFFISAKEHGSVGIGQLNTPAYEEALGVYSEDDGNQLARGGQSKIFLEEVAANTNLNCKNYAELARKDLNEKPASPRNNICKWVFMGEGLSRNLLYSFAYIGYLKKQILKRYNEVFRNKKNQDFRKKQELLEKLIMVGYSRYGLSEVNDFIRRAESKNLDEMLSLLNKTKYLIEVNGTLSEISDKTGDKFLCE